MEVNTQKLVQIIGKQTVQINLLEEQIQKLKAENEELKLKPKNE